MQHCLLYFIAVMFLCACSGSTGQAPSGTIRIAIGAEPKTIDPRYATDAEGWRISSLLFNSLVRVNSDLTTQLDAAESYSYSDLTYRFKLKTGLKFHNGQPLTKEDVEYSFEQFVNPKCPFYGSFKVIDFVKVDASGPKQPITVHIKLKNFSATFFSDLSAIKFLPKSHLQKVGDNFARNPIGTGSFKVEKIDSQQILLARVPDHPIVVPKVNRLEIKIVRDDTTRALKLLKGEIDLVQNEIPPHKLASFENNDKFKVHTYPGLSFSYILVNLQDPLLKQYPVRKAIAQAIDKQEIIKYKLRGLAQQASSLLTPANPFFFQSSIINYNLKAAKQALLPLESEKSLPELEIKTSNNQQSVQNGQILADQISKLGFKINLKSYEWGTYYADIQSGNFQLATMKWIGVVDPDIYRLAFHSAELPPRGRNRGRYVNEKLDKLLVQGTQIENLQQRIKHYQQIQKIIQDDLPIIPLWYNKQTAIVSHRVKNYKPSLYSDYSPLYYVTKE